MADARLLDDYPVHAMAAVPQLAIAIRPATTPLSVDEVGLSALLLRVSRPRLMRVASAS